MRAKILSIQDQLHKIDSSRIFQWLIITVIIISALLVGAKTHNLPAQALTILEYLDLGVTVFLLLSLLFAF